MYFWKWCVRILDTMQHMTKTRGVTIHMKHATRHLVVHGLRDNTYRKTTNEIPNVISHVMTWFHKHAEKSFKLKCAPAASEMFKFLVEFKFQAVSTVIVMFHVAKKKDCEKILF